MSDERQHHLYSRLKRVSMTNWNYTDKFLIVHHKMTKFIGLERLDIGSYIGPPPRLPSRLAMFH